MIKQNIVFIENKAGSLQKVTELLAEAGIDIYTSYHRENSLQIMILQTDNVFVTENVLSNNGFRVLNSLED